MGMMMWIIWVSLCEFANEGEEFEPDVFGGA